MNILFTGNGKSGSWKIRGEQLGAACGGIIKPNATLDDLKQADIIVVVKRVSEQLLYYIRQSGKPWIFDVVDFYPQPECTSWNRDFAVDMVINRINHLKPNAILWPNKCMKFDCSMGKIPSMVLYHHYRQGIKINPIREEIKTIGYEGSPNYLGTWFKHISTECLNRGWNFLINPYNLADLDIVLAFRDRSVNGYCQRNWKSNVKLANSHGSGTPFIGQMEQSYLETSTNYELFCEDKIGLKRALDAIEDYQLRQTTNSIFLSNAISVDTIAEQLKGFIHGL